MVRRKSVRRAKAEARGSKFLCGDPGLHRGPTPSYSPFSKQDAQRMINATFDLMSQTGISFDPLPRLMDQLSDAGCKVSSGGLVKFPVELIRRSLDSVAKNVRLWSRDEDLVERIDRELQEILQNHQPPALAAEILLELHSIADKFRQNHVANS